MSTRLKHILCIAFTVFFVGIPIVILFAKIDGFDASLLFTAIKMIAVCLILLYLFYGLLNLSFYRAFKAYVTLVNGNMCVTSLNLSKYRLTIKGRTVFVRITSGYARLIFLELPIKFENGIKFHIYARDWYDNASDRFDGVKMPTAEKEFYLIVENNVPKTKILELGNGSIMVHLKANFPLIRSVNVKKNKIDLIAMPKAQSYFISGLIDSLIKIEESLADRPKRQRR